MRALVRMSLPLVLALAFGASCAETMDVAQDAGPETRADSETTVDADAEAHAEAEAETAGDADAAEDATVQDGADADAPDDARLDADSSDEADAEADADSPPDAPDDAPLDADSSDEADAEADADSPPDAPDDGPLDADADGSDASDAAEDVGPPGPGTYLYRRIPVGGLHEATVVAFHPDGSYALVLERTEAVHVYDWATDTATRVDLRVGGRALTLGDVAFDPSGSFALIVGYETVSGSDTGVLIEVSDAAIRAGTPAAAFTRLSETRAGERFSAIEYPPPGEGAAGDGRPVVLSQSGPTPGYIARLREFDLATRTFGGMLEARATSAGCDDLAFADNEFGGWGIVLVCGTNGADAPYYTPIGGVGEWRPGPAATLGNTSRAATHGAGDLALAISWSGRRLNRFEDGAWVPYSSSPGWSTLGVWDVSFAPDGRRALVVGRAGGSPLRGTVLEYRYDLYSAAAITDVSIPGFSAAPYLGDSNTNLNDSAFRPGCDGGLIVGGYTSWAGSTGQLIEFSIEGGTACR